MSPEMLALFLGFGGGLLGGLAVAAGTHFRRKRRDSGTGAEDGEVEPANQATLKEHLKRAERLDKALKGAIGNKEIELKLSEMKERVNASFGKQFSVLKTELNSRIDNLALRVTQLERGALRETGSGRADIQPVRLQRTDGGRPELDFNPLPAQSTPRESEAKPSVIAEPAFGGSPGPALENDSTSVARRGPESGIGSRPKTDVSQLIISHFDDIDGKSMRRLDTMKTQYKEVCPQITDIKDSNGAYIFTINGGIWLVHPTPNAPLTQYWERAFPRAESYTRVIQRVTCLARIRPVNDQEYEVLQEGSFVVR